jgi:hypothetical protein
VLIRKYIDGIKGKCLDFQERLKSFKEVLLYVAFRGLNEAEAAIKEIK